MKERITIAETVKNIDFANLDANAPLIERSAFLFVDVFACIGAPPQKKITLTIYSYSYCKKIVSVTNIGELPHLTRKKPLEFSF
jgi:hypothetical protein